APAPAPPRPPNAPRAGCPPITSSVMRPAVHLEGRGTDSGLSATAAGRGPPSGGRGRSSRRALAPADSAVDETSLSFTGTPPSRLFPTSSTPPSAQCLELVADRVHDV